VNTRKEFKFKRGRGRLVACPGRTLECDEVWSEKGGVFEMGDFSKGN